MEVADLTWQLSLTGLLVGLLVGMTGMGGGSLMTPLLILLFNFNPAMAVSTDIVHGAISKSFGAARHRTLGTVHARLTFWLFAGSGMFALLGLWFRHQLSDDSAAQDTLGRIVGLALILGGTGFLAKMFIKRGVQASDLPFLLSNRDRAIAVATGAIGGFIVGLTSVGSGTFFGLVMLLVFPLTAQKIVGTDIFHAAVLLGVIGVADLITGDVNMSAVGWLLIGSVPGILIGSQVTRGIPERLLRLSFSAILILSGFKLIDVASSQVTNWTIASGVVGFLAAIGAWGVVHWRNGRRATGSPEVAGEIVPAAPSD